MAWFIASVVFVFVLAFVIIKLSINKNENKDSSLGILEHPSTFKKQGVEMVDESLKSKSSQDLTDS
ncbi:hypothetical protein [Winogradskyella tangerina]|uniref:hypothetical protein n=1 Tax=Winogradskyella tangerina TaxID=2023240 RepID=UPI000DBE8EB7|nr:hypothetical protein [Winogradskyella tangerina]